MMNTHRPIALLILLTACGCSALDGGADDAAPVEIPTTSRGVALEPIAPWPADAEATSFTTDVGLLTLTQAQFVLRDIELDLPRGLTCADVRHLLDGGATCHQDGDDRFDDSRSGDDRFDDNPSGDDRSGDDRSGDDRFDDDPSGDDRNGDDRNGDDRNDDDRFDDNPSGDDRNDDDRFDDNPSDDDRFDDSRSGSDDHPSEAKIRIRGPFLVDLMRGAVEPSLDAVRIPDLAYRHVDLRVDDHDGLLNGASWAMAADFEYDGQPLELRATLRFSEDIRLESRSGVRTDGSPLRVGFDVAAWFTGLTIAQCLDEGRLSVDGGTLHISEEADLGDCSELEGSLKDNLKNSARLR